MVPAGAPPVTLMTAEEARACAEEIKRHLNSARVLLLEFDEREGWRALGHASWREWAADELGQTQRYAYYELAAARVEQNLLNHGANVQIGALPERRLRPLSVLEPEEQVEVAATLDLHHTTSAQVEQAVQAHRERKEAKPQAEAHAERIAVYEQRAAERVAEPSLDELFGRIVRADALTYLRGLPDGCVDVCITSPPYWAKRTYTDGDPDELGQERRPEWYISALVQILGEVGRVLTDTGWLFLNLGDTYASKPGQYRGDPNRAQGLSDKGRLAAQSAPADRQWDVPDKSLCLIPWRVLHRLVLERAWICRNVIVWHKRGHQPENVFDRLTQAWEPVFALTKSKQPYFKRLPGAEDLWQFAVGRQGRGGDHPAVFPENLVRGVLGMACPPGGVALDPFAGSGTVRKVAREMGCKFLGCDLVRWGAGEATG